MPSSHPDLGTVKRNSDAALADAMVAVAQLEQQIDHLWREALASNEAATSDQLAGVCHALRRATSLLQRNGVIG